MLKFAAGNDPADHAKQPVHQKVYAQLRARVLFGDLIPGQPVTLQGLVVNMNAGMTPVREAVRRLTSEGALLMMGNRRVIVPELTSSCLDEIEFMRLSLELELVRRAVGRLDDGDITALEQMDSALNKAVSRGDISGYLSSNYHFHRLLYARAEAPILAASVDGLWLRFGPSLRVVCGLSGTLNLPDRHLDLLRALKVRNTEQAVAAIKGDVLQGVDQIRKALLVPSSENRFD
ncbi:MAG: GntR family transcriptional regulator [Roseobacter sp.]